MAAFRNRPGRLFKDGSRAIFALVATLIAVIGGPLVARAQPVELAGVFGRPADLSGVRFDRVELKPLLAQLVTLDKDIRAAQHAVDVASDQRSGALKRADDARLKRSEQLAVAETARLAEHQARQRYEETIEPRADAERMMSAAAINDFVRQDLNLILDTGTKFNERRTRAVYSATVWRVAHGEWERLVAEMAASRRDEAEALRQVDAAELQARQLSAAAAAADQAATDAQAASATASTTLASLQAKAAPLWASMLEIGRRPDPTTTTTAPPPPSTIPLVSVDPALVVRLSGTALSSGGPLGPLITYQTFDFPKMVLDAYVLAAAAMDRERPNCHMRWELLAAIGKVESVHGRIFGNTVDSSGNVRPGIRGPALDGINFAYISDTDGGAYDGDTVYDRAVGPMQFIPGSWRIFGRDGNGDGVRDPHNYFDAAQSAANLLCRGEIGRAHV